MNVDDSYTSKWCSDLFGEGEIEEYREGLSYGAHQMRDGVSANKVHRIKRAILPSQFAQLKTGCGYMKLPEMNPALVRFKEFHLEGKQMSFIENKELKKLFAEEMKKAQIEKAELEKKMQETSDNRKTKNNQMLNLEEETEEEICPVNDDINETSPTPENKHKQEMVF